MTGVSCFVADLDNLRMMDSDWGFRQSSIEHGVHCDWIQLLRPGKQRGMKFCRHSIPSDPTVHTECGANFLPIREWAHSVVGLERTGCSVTDTVFKLGEIFKASINLRWM